MKIVFCTHCDSWLEEQFGYSKMINSFKYFHPDIELITFDENDTNRIVKENIGFNLWSWMGLTMKEAMEKSGADMVCHIDTDSIVLDRFSEIIDCKDGTEIFSVRNDGEQIGDRDESINRPVGLKTLPNSQYVNCGLIATTSIHFLNEWIDYNKYLIEKYGDIRNATPECPIVEQGSFNLLFHSGMYKTKILDDVNSNLLYGASANMPSPNNYPIPESIIKNHNGVSNWSSWKDITYKNYNFWLYGKKLKCLHMAGGSMNKINYDMFSDKIATLIKEITNEI